MKIISIGTKLINLDKIILIDTEKQEIFLENDHSVVITEEELKDFVTQYNLYDTNEIKILLERVSRVVLTNPEYLTKEGIQEQIIMKVKYYKLEKKFKEITGGLKLKNLPIKKLMEVYREIMEITTQKQKEGPF
jgi:hypothetical protein